jgi:4-diphosphocytidyl-2-C-methyl-D-erythritol kinase
LDAIRLKQIAAEIGSDVAFFLSHRAARCTGRGEIVEHVPSAKPLHFVIVCPKEGLTTAKVYGGVKVPPAPRSADAICSALATGDVDAIGHELFNRLLEPAEALCPAVRELRTILTRLRPVGVLMSGSGSSLFALCRDADDAREFAQRLRAELSSDPAPRVFVVSTCVTQ